MTNVSLDLRWQPFVLRLPSLDLRQPRWPSVAGLPSLPFRLVVQGLSMILKIDWR